MRSLIFLQRSTMYHTQMSYQVLLALCTIGAVWTLECWLLAAFPALVIDHRAPALVRSTAANTAKHFMRFRTGTNLSSTTTIHSSCCCHSRSNTGWCCHTRSSCLLTLMTDVCLKPFTFEDAEKNGWIVFVVSTQVVVIVDEIGG